MTKAKDTTGSRAVGSPWRFRNRHRNLFAMTTPIRRLTVTACLAVACGTDTPPQPTGPTRTHSTTFTATENPISEGGRWINGGTAGLDWSDVSTANGRAIGLEFGPDYTDATALLVGPWGADQQVTATVFADQFNDACFHEVEIRLRSTIAAHSNTGYEIGFKVSTTSQAYLNIVRWNGPHGSFDYLHRGDGAQFGVQTGDVISATIVGDVITAYKNGVAMGQATDDTFDDGSPGMGFNVKNSVPGCPGTNPDYGFTALTATDSVVPPDAALRPAADQP